MNLYHAALFCLASCLCCDTAAASWAPNCCLKTSHARVSVKRFAYYTVHRSGLCPINAIAFWTHKGRKLCYDPDLDWVKNAMKTVSAKPENSGAVGNTKKRKGKGRKRKGKQNKQ